MYAGHRVCGFLGISGRDKARVLLLPAATVAKLDLVYVHADNSPTGHSCASPPYGSPLGCTGRSRESGGKYVPTHLSGTGAEKFDPRRLTKLL